MSDPTQIPLRMAASESAEALAQRYERERRRVRSAQEDSLQEQARAFRIGSVPHLNAAPLTRGLEQHTTFLPPAALAEALRSEQLDAALLSITEVLRQDRYDVLDGVAVASLGEVKSVFLAHRGPLDAVRVVHCEPTSLTSVMLLRVLLAEHGLQPEIRPLSDDPRPGWPDHFLLIGDRGLQYLHSSHDRQIWDLGAAWTELTGLPFVYAVWVLRRAPDLDPLRRLLREARRFGLETLDSLIAERTEFTPAFRRDYLTWHIHYHLGSDERRGIERFMEMMVQHGHGPVFAPRYVA
jgi:predicted solute-binding protein